MQYSPENNIPYIGLVDAGTVELVRKSKKKIVSSADLVQKFEATWSPDQLASHLEAGRIIDRITQDAFERAATLVRQSQPISEFELQQWILEQFRANSGVITSEPPIAAVQPNNGNPHYEPKDGASRPIRAGDLLLLDIWGKLDRKASVYYDITWVGYLGARGTRNPTRKFSASCGRPETAPWSSCRNRSPRAAKFTAGRWTASRVKSSARPATASILSIARATASDRKRTAMARIWTAWKRATIARSSRAPAFRSSRESTCPNSGFAAKIIPLLA
jgi:hypothetical protein